MKKIDESLFEDVTSEFIEEKESPYTKDIFDEIAEKEQMTNRLSKITAEYIKSVVFTQYKMKYQKVSQYAYRDIVDTTLEIIKSKVDLNVLGLQDKEQKRIFVFECLCDALKDNFKNKYQELNNLIIKH